MGWRIISFHLLWFCVLEDVCSCQDDNMVDVRMIVLRNCGIK